MIHSIRNSVLIVLTVFFFCNSVSCANRRLSFKGSIAAYRPADRAFQVASFVENKELFLFQTEGGNKNLLKLVYIHYGYSDLKDDVLSGAKRITIIVQRKKSCDQTLDMFEKDAPSVQIEGDLDTIGKKVIFTGDESHEIQNSYLLKCYVLDHWEPIE